MSVQQRNPAPSRPSVHQMHPIAATRHDSLAHCNAALDVSAVFSGVLEVLHGAAKSQIAPPSGPSA